MYNIMKDVFITGKLSFSQISLDSDFIRQEIGKLNYLSQQICYEILSQGKSINSFQSFLLKIIFGKEFDAPSSPKSSLRAKEARQSRESPGITKPSNKQI
jgi:hypothetical protein